MRLTLDVKAAGMNGGNGRRVPVLSIRENSTGLVRVQNSFEAWFARRSWGVFLATAYPLLVLTPLAILAALQAESDQPRIAEAGGCCAIVGFTVLSLQFVITARLRWIEAPFGLDLILAFHRTMALVAAGLLGAHALLVSWAEGWSLLVGLRMPWYIWAGRVALAALLVHVILNLWRRVLRLSFERWRHVHNVFALSILAIGLTHALAVGQDGPPGMIFVWSALMAIASGSWVYSRLIRPRLMSRRPFRVIAVKPEAPRIWTLALEPPEGEPFNYAPGQFQFLRLHGMEISAEEHPFTIASSPTRPGHICLTIKESGDFTNQISRIRPGDHATVHGPFGRFSYTLHPDEDELVFVAAGVGITPLMSMLRHMRDRREPRSVLLIYASRRPPDMLFYGELMAMQAGAWPLLTVVHVLSEPAPWWRGETGRLDADRLVRLCEGVEGKAFYLCCAPAMTAALVRGLRHKGVSPRHIHTDHFSL